MITQQTITRILHWGRLEWGWGWRKEYLRMTLLYSEFTTGYTFDPCLWFNLSNYQVPGFSLFWKI